MKSKVLNVVSVFFSVPFFFGDQLLHFHEKGYEVHVICSPSNKIKQYSLLKKFRYVEIPILRSFSIFYDIRAIIKLRKYILKNNIKIVSGHTAKGSLLTMIASFLSRTPNRIYFRHGFYYETCYGFKKILMLNLDRLTSFLATKVVCVSPYVLEKSIELKLTSKNKLILLNKGSCNGVDCHNKFNPIKINNTKLISLKSKFNLNEYDFVIGYTGRLVRDKGIVELVKAFQKISEKNSKVALLLVGPFETRDSIPSNIQNIIENNVNIMPVGLIENDMEYFYELMNVLVLPTHREGLGTSLLEASSMKKPVLTTSHTGSRDAIKDKITGLFIDKSMESIVEKIQFYIDNPLIANKHGAAGRNFITENFDQKIIWDEIEKLYI
jgi:glycosyltransferase involved in cell wall biosynthesis